MCKPSTHANIKVGFIKQLKINVQVALHALSIVLELVALQTNNFQVDGHVGDNFGGEAAVRAGAYM